MSIRRCHRVQRQQRTCKEKTRLFLSMRHVRKCPIIFYERCTTRARRECCHRCFRQWQMSTRNIQHSCLIIIEHCRCRCRPLLTFDDYNQRAFFVTNNSLNSIIYFNTYERIMRHHRPRKTLTLVR
jgi:hypothetical protein